MEVSITGAKIYYVIPGINYPITQTVVNAWIAMVVIVGLCIWLTRGMQVHARTKRQVVAEMIVQMAQKLVRGNMGAKWDSFVPFIVQSDRAVSSDCRSYPYSCSQLFDGPDRRVFPDK